MFESLKLNLVRYKSLIVSIACFILVIIVVGVAASKKTNGQIVADVKTSTAEVTTPPTPEAKAPVEESPMRTKIEINGMGNRIVMDLREREKQVYNLVVLDRAAPYDLRFIARLLARFQGSMLTNKLSAAENRKLLSLMFDSALNLPKDFQRIVNYVYEQADYNDSRASATDNDRLRSMADRLWTVQLCLEKIADYMDYQSTRK